MFPRRLSRVTDRMCRQARPGRHHVDGCLYLFVRKSGSRSWLVRLTVRGKRRDFGLGPYSVVSLAEARQLAEEYRRVAHRGDDPREAESPSAPTVREALAFVIEEKKDNWTEVAAEARYRAMFERYILPVFGDMRVDEVTVQDCFKFIEPKWKGRGSLGFRLRHQLVHLMKWAVRQEYRTDNPAENVLGRLPHVKSHAQHQPSLPYSETGAALKALQSAPVPDVFKLLIPFLVLTGVRLREASEAKWSEVKLAEKLWVIPAKRMKARERHRVPLSRQAVRILEEARAMDPSGALVFGFRKGRRRPRAVHSAEVLKVLRELGLTDDDGRDVVTHGFRSTFTEWTGDNTNYSEEVSEAALAHGPSGPTRKAYRRKDLLEKRRPLMQEWADYVLPPERS